MHAIRIGVAGWALGKETAELFPKQGTHLERYSRLMNSVEINSSFYRPHRRTTYERWAQCTPATFRFAVKLPKQITHVKALCDAEAELDQFVAECTGLGEKLGPILVQLPPRLPWDEDLARRFFSALRSRHTGTIVCEPRHESWFTPEADSKLQEFQIARVGADPSTVPSGFQPGGSSITCYYRLHGSPRIYYSTYGEDFLRSVAGKLRAAAANCEAVWCIFDNTAKSAAIPNAFSLMQILAEPSV